MFIFYIIVLLILSFRIDLFLTRFVRHDEKWVPSRFGAQIWYTKRLFVYLTRCNTTFHVVYASNADKVNPLNTAVSYPRTGRSSPLWAQDNEVAMFFLCPRMTTTETNSETRRRVCSSPFFLLVVLPHPWRPTFARINVRLGTLATVPSGSMIYNRRLKLRIGYVEMNG